jgi:phosphoribosylglycinamide formyltransferase-1
METSTLARLAVFASGTGSLLKAKIYSGLPIKLVVVDRPCKAFEIAEAAGLRTVLLHREGKWHPSRGFDDKRIEYTRRVEHLLCQHSIELVAMAGFLSVLAPDIFIFFKDRIVNSHPSLLPLFKGEHAVRDALLAGVAKTGTTIHIATPELDEGPILSQIEVPILPGDTEDTLWERIKVEERIEYPRVLRKLMQAIPATREGTYERSLPLTRFTKTTEAPP